MTHNVECQIYHAERYLRDQDKLKEQHREWAKKHPEEVAAISRRRRARVRGAVGSHTVNQWERRKAEYGYRCAYCGKEGLKLTEDHVIPVSKGGMDTIDNIVPACKPCNSRKHNKIIGKIRMAPVQIGLC